MAFKYQVISADSHLEIAPDRWTPRVPSAYRDRAPRRIKLPDGGDGLIIEGREMRTVGLAITGKPPEQHTLEGVSYDGGPGAGSPEQRLQEQDQDGVDAEIMFTGPGNFMFWRGIADNAAYRAVIHAYNEFLAEEYCAVAPDRLIAMGVIPITNVEDAVAEMEYCANAGLKGVTLATFPSGQRFPTPEDDRFWAAALDLQMPLTVHVGFVNMSGPSFRYERRPDVGGFGADPIQQLARFGGGGNTSLNIIQLMLAGVFDRFPYLCLYFAETMVGWLPFFLEQVDDNWRRDRHWINRHYGIKPLQHQPSEYLRQHCWWGFLKDPYGVRNRHDVGIERIMWGNDFPHSASDWPDSRKIIEEIFVGVPEDERTLMLCGNATKYFHLENKKAGN